MFTGKPPGLDSVAIRRGWTHLDHFLWAVGRLKNNLTEVQKIMRCSDVVDILNLFSNFEKAKYWMA